MDKYLLISMSGANTCGHYGIPAINPTALHQIFLEADIKADSKMSSPGADPAFNSIPDFIRAPDVMRFIFRLLTPQFCSTMPIIKYCLVLLICSFLHFQEALSCANDWSVDC